MSSILETLKSVIAKLKTETDLTNIIDTRIYSDVPQNPIYPFMTIAIESEPELTYDATDYNHRVYILGFSKEATPVQVLQIRDAVVNALHHQEDSIILSGYACNSSKLISLDYFKSDDLNSFQSVAIFQLNIS